MNVIGHDDVTPHTPAVVPPQPTPFANEDIVHPRIDEYRPAARHTGGHEIDRPAFPYDREAP